MIRFFIPLLMLLVAFPVAARDFNDFAEDARVLPARAYINIVNFTSSANLQNFFDKTADNLLAFTKTLQFTVDESRQRLKRGVVEVARLASAGSVRVITQIFQPERATVTSGLSASISEFRAPDVKKDVFDPNIFWITKIDSLFSTSSTDNKL